MFQLIAHHSVKQGFRTAVQLNPALNAERANFFNAPGRPMQVGPMQQAFDLSSMGRALDGHHDGATRRNTPLMSQEFRSTGKTQGDVSNWAAEFSMEGPLTNHSLQPMHTQSRSVTPQPLGMHSAYLSLSLTQSRSAPSFVPMNHLARPGPSMMHMYPMSPQAVMPQLVMASAPTSGM